MDKHERTFFAVTSLGKTRWYWVVWPSLAQLEQGESSTHIDEGYCDNKADAVDKALEVAGFQGEWVAAKYAKQYRKGRSSQQGTNAPDVVEVLYNDQQVDEQGRWQSVPHRVMKRTKRYVYVEQRPYNPAELTGSWLDHDAKYFRLDRQMLERDGYAFVSINEAMESDLDEPIFFTKPYGERLAHIDGAPLDYLYIFGLTLPFTEQEVKSAYRRLVKQLHPDMGGDPEQFLQLQEAYKQALRLCS